MKTQDESPKKHSESSNRGEVFISYTHDNPEHIQRVLALSNKLRGEGIDCVLDLYEASPPEGWPIWMDRKISKSQYVLMVCTEGYYQRVMGGAEKSEGLGIRWEGKLINQHIYDSGSENVKFIPVVFDKGDIKHIPTPVKSATRYKLDEDYDKLYLRLRGVPEHIKPPLGDLRPLPAKEVNTNIAVFITMPINVDAWVKAEWDATAYFPFPDRPPMLGLGFRNEEGAREIFEDWRERYGEGDEYEELRIAIIEGDIEGEERGYSVHVGPNIENILRRAVENGLATYEDENVFIALTRVNRMSPEPSSTNLEKFKEAFEREKLYSLIPVILGETKELSRPIFDLGIIKSEIMFRRIEEISETDIDSLVMKKNYKN